MRRHPIVSICIGFLALAGCSADSASTDPSTVGPAIGRGKVTVFAASSLTGPFQASAAGLAPLEVTFSFAGSSSLVTQLTTGGAPADVVATADQDSMGRLVSADLVDPPVVFATNTLVIAVAKGNPKGVASLADLARSGTSVVLADPTVPVGRYARQALDAARVTVTPKSLELDVKATLARVESGEADAAIVYATDVKASSRTEAVVFPEAAAIVASYPIAVVKATKNRPGAEAFVASARQGAVHDALKDAGFGS